MNGKWIIAAAGFSFVAALPAASDAAPPAAPRSRDAETVHRTGEAYGRLLVDESPEIQISRGIPIRELPDPSIAHEKAVAERARDLLAPLSDIDAAKLPLEDALSLGVLRIRLGRLAESGDSARFENPATPYGGALQVVHLILSEERFASPEDADRYLSLLDQYPAFLDRIEARLRESAAAGVVAPKPEIPVIAAFVSSFAGEGDASPFAVERARLSALPADRADAFERDVRARIAGNVVPATRKLAAYVEGEYASRAPEGVGLSQYPGGLAAYRSFIRRNTGLDLSPEEIHRIGLEEIARIRGELEALRRREGFAGDLDAFRASLKTDKRFFPSSPDEIGRRLMAAVRRIEPKIKDEFDRLPKAPYGVRRLDPALEPGMTFGYYQEPTPLRPEGDYRFNGSRLSERSLLNAAPLIYHELIPGHHFQINLQKENTALPDWRREDFNETAYVEGWGEYASALAGELGMYADPDDACGRLAMDSFVSARLVVDTGMNALGWSRERAIAYMKENTFEADLQIGTETLRYSADIPAQALGYKLGARKIRELREKAKAALGPAFDVRKFHDAVLGSGSLPLPVLETRIDAFIAESGKRASAAGSSSGADAR